MGDVRGELEAYVKDWYDKFPEGDAAAMRSLYTEDARLFLTGAPGVRGDAAIGKMLASIPRYLDISCRHEVNDVDLVAPGVAVVTGSAWAYATPKAGGAPEVEASRFVMVMKRDQASGAWRCHYDVSQHTPDVAPRPAP